MRFCRDPGDEPNGSRQPRRPPNRRGFPQGSPVEYFCNSGYDLIGERIIYCSISGDWSASRPRCESQSRTPGKTLSLIQSMLFFMIKSHRYICESKGIESNIDTLIG